MTFNRRCFRRIAVALLLVADASLSGHGAWVQSPTLNEPSHLIAGISFWKYGRFDIYCVNPPLVRLAAAAPVLLAHPETDWHSYSRGPHARPEFSLGEDFVAANGERSLWLFALARWACIPFSLLGGFFCYRWGQRLYGELAGLLALSLWCFCPNMLGHGHLITPDVPAAALALAAGYSFWLWLQQPTWTRALASGAVLGLAELTKTSLIVLLPLWFVLWIVYRWPDRRRLGSGGWARELGMLAARLVLALYVLNLGYGFEGSFTQLGDLKFISKTLGAENGAEQAPASGGNRFAQTWLGKVPVPLPKNYLLGIDMQRSDFDGLGRPSYLGCQFQDTGWWYYYLYAAAIKVPLGTWLLFLLAAGRSPSRRSTKPVDPNEDLSGKVDSTPNREREELGAASWRDEFVLLMPAIAIFAFVSSQTGFNEHIRYVLPAFPFFFVWIGRLGPLLGRKRQFLTAVVCASLLWSVGSSLAVYPHGLSYFNELVGGPLGGPNHLLNSNVDWGQDLLFLKRWIDEHPEAAPLRLAYFGGFDPMHLGITYEALVPPVLKDGDSKAISPGWYAISVNFVRGLPFFSYNGDGAGIPYEQDALVAFQKLKPVATAGYSIYIYHVE